ncbi:uncharacterized protein PHACADRAFT_142460 [Phanerochaete carnosa HHB-10118-sp]|uniref:VWFA domain-containing protein n=1 Tax=Phanerochaete carnosa (strain HHB-10118-sp) TaxID=650164 RepID=K5WDW3_PHACS|nr:uncharacterized protein PHACADRAFT_142460 [Phanerochaete carnosa HHB-10118-sp]EKM57239.1 hypothetical protein PHACADRAFT_142460 [Phanerochaete carnosa HHB-10118-sp]
MQLHNTTNTRPCGIAHVLPDLSEAYLPLEKADIHADVIDVSAIVTITQHFWQCSSGGLQKARYVFPVPARAAVCGFKMTTEDGTVIAAVAKEKEEAKHEHEQAISQGRVTGLVEHVADDIFSISLGALPSCQMIQAHITASYVLDLMDEDACDQVRIQIPVYVGMRYGKLPDGMKGTYQIPPHRISISADVRVQGAVKNITSPTHPAVIVSDGNATHTSRNASYTSPEFLTQDFVLSVTADGLDAPRCFCQKAKNGTTAIQLNIVPKFNLPSIPKQEYIFLVDRSGSMKGDRIETAKKTLVMLLRALPSQDTHLNIFSFGTQCNSLWNQSVPYDEQTLGVATQHVDGMLADYGGTVIQSALQQVFASRRVDIPTACFVLTDGQAHNIDDTLGAVDHAVKAATLDAPLRVFTLGIGATTSTALCEGIARVGNGVCLMATASESIMGKCSKLLRASRTYILKNVTPDWGVRVEAYHTGNNELKGVLQAPAQVSSIYPGNRFIVFALVEDEKFTPPQEVVICAQRDGHGQIYRFSIPVQTVELPSDSQALIPTLAARRAIMDLDGSSKAQSSPDVKVTMVRLGTEYQLASKYTSFIAVDRRTMSEIADEQAWLVQRRPEAARAVLFYVSSSHARSQRGIVLTSPRVVMHCRDAQLQSTTVATTNSATSPGAPMPSAADRPQEATPSDDAPRFTDSRVLSLSDMPEFAITIEDKVLAMVRLQSFDGSFRGTDRLEALIGRRVLAECTLSVVSKVWATALAIAFLKKHMKDQLELLDGLVEKATDFISRTSNVDIETLLAHAETFVP